MAGGQPAPDPWDGLMGDGDQPVENGEHRQNLQQHPGCGAQGLQHLLNGFKHR